MNRQPVEQPDIRERIRAELRSLRAKVADIQGSLVATSDGLLVAYDISEQEPTRLAALISTTLSLARQSTAATGLGEFREAVARGTEGYLTVYAAGSSAVVAVIGSNHLNVAMLHYEARETIEKITAHAAHFARWSGTRKPQPRSVRRDDLSNPLRVPPANPEGRY